MPAPRKYDEETRARAVRMPQDRLRERGESTLTARRAVGVVLDIDPATLRNWVEREEIDGGVRPGVTSEASEEVEALGSEGRRAAPGRGDPRDSNGFLGSGGARPPTQAAVDDIRAHKDRLGVEPICRVLTEHGVKIAPSTYSACVVSPAR